MRKKGDGDGGGGYKISRDRKQTHPGVDDYIAHFTGRL